MSTRTRLSRPGSSSSSSRSRSRCRGPRSSAGRVSAAWPGRASVMADVSAVVVSLNALPWLETSLASVRAYETILVDAGSTDGTLELARERFPEVRVLERENRGLAAGWNAGIEVASGRYFLLLNADAWAVGDAVEQLVAFAEAHPRAAVVGPPPPDPHRAPSRSPRGLPPPSRPPPGVPFPPEPPPRPEA